MKITRVEPQRVEEIVRLIAEAENRLTRLRQSVADAQHDQSGWRDAATGATRLTSTSTALQSHARLVVEALDEEAGR